MAPILSAYQLNKSFSANDLFTELTFAVEPGDRIGLIGPNGMGKSTLLKILAKEISPDQGKLSFTAGIRTGYLAQEPVLDLESTIFEVLTEDLAEDDWSSMGLAHEYISRFDLLQFGEKAKVKTLSGGWRKRVALARELIKKPDLLLLDEPTNHLDVEGIMWLEKYLARAPFATIVVTHDRLFLQRVTNQIIELDRRHAGGLLRVKGDYQQYLETREQMISGQERREVILSNVLRRETEWLKRGAKARATKQQARIDRAGDLKEEVEDLSRRNLSRTATLEFRSVGRSPKKLIEAEKISKTYGDRTVFSEFDLKLTPKSRIGLLGSNGAGKSTLIKVLMGVEEPTTGKVFRSDQLQVAYFDQTREALDPDISLKETVCPDGSHVDFCGQLVHVRSYLSRFLFDERQIDLAVGKLSGGEQSRLMIAQLMLKPANVLVLDEPTNDLDLATLGVLEECIRDFAGAVILVTHDRYFLDQVVRELIAFPNPSSGESGLERFVNFTQWEAWLTQKGGPAQSKKKSNHSKSGSSSAPAAKKKKLTFKEQHELDKMESVIHDVEKELAGLTQESADPKKSSNPSFLQEISAKMAETQLKIDQLYARWQELEKKAPN